MRKYKGLYNSEYLSRMPNPFNLFIQGLIGALIVFTVLNVPRWVDFGFAEKVHIGDYHLEYIGKYVKKDDVPPFLSNFFLVYQVVGSNGETQAVTLEVSRSSYNSATPTPDWTGVASIYERDDEERYPYFKIGRRYFSVVKFDSAEVTEDYWGGVWVNDLYKPIIHDETYEVTEVL